MYHIYHTTALVLGGESRGEADRALHLFTRDLGLIAVYAKSIRASGSKLRYALQSFAHADIDLVRGKSGWKLTSARSRDPHAHLWKSERKRRALATHARLLRRLVTGEEEHSDFYDDMLAGVSFLGAVPDEHELLRDAELLLVLRTLDALGYWGDKGGWAQLLYPMPWDRTLLAHVRTERPKLLAAVNNALKATQL